MCRSRIILESFIILEGHNHCALWVASLRHKPTDSVDYGGGKAKFVIGMLMPTMTRDVNVTAGPDGDGLICIIRLPKDGVARVEQSQLLELIAPEALLIISHIRSSKQKASIQCVVLSIASSKCRQYALKVCSVKKQHTHINFVEKQHAHMDLDKHYVY